MKQVLLFPEYRSSHHKADLGQTETSTAKSACFMAIFHPKLDETHMQSLSSRFMRWSDQVWIVDLSPCLSYWKYQADRVGLPLYAWLRQLIQSLYPQHSYYAALASEPWQALILMKLMEEKEHNGLLTYDSNTGENLYRHLSWSCWWRCCEEYLVTATQTQLYSKSQVNHLQQALHRMEITIKRLGIALPVQFLTVPLAQIRRRFGEALSLLWALTFPDFYQNTNKVRNSLKQEPTHRSVAQPLFPHRFFPWIPYHIAEKPSRKRTLDYPLSEWGHIELLLRDDFHALSFLDSFKKEDRIINLEWRVVLQNQVEIFIVIPFRHPHDLQRETPHYRTALLQVHYQFEKNMQELQQLGRDLDQAVPAIAHWELQIAETITVMPQPVPMFENESEDLNQLIELENRLPIPLQNFHSKLHWVPEDSYQRHSAEKQPSSARSLTNLTGKDWEQDCLQIMAKHRPLYIYQEPRSMLPSSSSSLWRFQERVMDKWWQQQLPNSHRDYYRCLLDQQNLWTFRNANGKCYVHGIFS